MTSEQPYIVVGMDSSRAASEALAWAAREARLRGAVLRVIRAWRMPASAGVLTHTHDRDLVAREALRDTLDLAAAVLSDQAPDVDVSVEVPEGPAGPVLVQAAADAELLAVGTRGVQRWPADSSVDRYCVAHSRCPVVAVPPASHAAGGTPRRPAAVGHGHAVRPARHGRHRTPR
jgi:nucleotide-binding universal stress UspA family protein